jgi:hypothetical protein
VGILTLEGGGGLVTVTVAELLTVALPFEAVAVYVVLTVGLTLFELFRATVPMPLSMITDVAFVDVHVSVDDPPAAIDAGDAVSWIVGVAGGGGVDTVTVTVTELFALALPLLAVAV